MPIIINGRGSMSKIFERSGVCSDCVCIKGDVKGKNLISGGNLLTEGIVMYNKMYLKKKRERGE